MIRFIVSGLCLVACAIAFAGARSLALDTSSTANQASITVPIAAQGGSGQTGTATLTGTADNKTQVVIALNGASTVEPAHIHRGTCANLDPKPAYPLANVNGGASTSIIPVPLASLETGQFSINVHESTSNLGTYVACGTIPAAPTSAMPQPMST
jgi:hypothetical protein